MSGQDVRADAGGIRIARLFGIPIFVTRAWIVIAIVATLVFRERIEFALPGTAGYVVAAGLFLALYLSVLVHELGHSVVALGFGLPVRRITLHFLGGVSEIEEEPPSPWKEFAVAAIGPAISLVLAGIGFLVAEAMSDGTLPYAIVINVATTNLLVGLFNLLPGLPLDGGRVFRAGAWAAVRDPFRATVMAARAGQGVAVLVLVAGFYVALVRPSEPDPVQLVIAFVLSAFIWNGAAQSLVATAVRRRIAVLSVRALTRRALSVAADLPLAEAVRRAREAQAGALVVVDPDGRPTAVVSEAAVAATPEHRRPWMQVGEVARGVVPAMCVSTDLDGAHLLRAMQAHPASEYVVMEPSGHLYGVLVTTDVEKALSRA
jgi:Zn-dependent protease/CBS domain-containing protein